MRKTSKRTAATSGPRQGAGLILSLVTSGDVPDFLSTIVRQVVDRACDHVGYARPLYEQGCEGDNLRLLTNLCRKTRQLDVAEFESTAAALAHHLLAIHDHPLPPKFLHEAVGCFVTDGTNLEISACEFEGRHFPGDVSMIQAWTWDVKTIEKAIQVATIYEQQNPDTKT